MVAPVLYNRCPTCIDQKMSQTEFDSLVNISDNKLGNYWRSGSIADYRLEAIRDWITNIESTYYLIGSVVGPHPYPMMVRDFQAIIGRESILQMQEEYG